MRLTVRRVGGQLPALRPSRTIEDQQIPPDLRESLLRFLREARPLAHASHPEAFTYVFDLDLDGERLAASAPFDQVPEELRALLP